MRTAAMHLVLLTLVVSVPALAPAQGGGEAEKLFRAMEERLAKAKSVRLGIRIETEANGKKGGWLKGSLAFTRSGQLRFASETVVEGGLIPLHENETVTSDGKRMRQIWVINKEVYKDREIATPKNLSAEFARILSRPGFSCGYDAHRTTAARGKGLKASEVFPVTDLKLGAREKVEGRQARQLTFKTRDHKKRTIDVTLWVDSVARLPLKRVAVMTQKGVTARFTELYTEIHADVKLDPKQFELPK